MTAPMLVDVIHELVIWLQDDTQCEYVILTKAKEIRLLKEVTPRHANSNTEVRGAGGSFNPDTDIPDCRPKR